MKNPFEKDAVKEKGEFKEIKMPYHYLFVMYNDKLTDKIKSLDPFFLLKFIEEHRESIIHYSLSNKTVDPSQYDELE